MRKTAIKIGVLKDQSGPTFRIQGGVRLLQGASNSAFWPTRSRQRRKVNAIDEALTQPHRAPHT